MGLGNVVAYCKNNLGLALARRGALEEARRVETDALHAFRKQGDGRLAHSSHLYLALIRLQSGDVAGAERDARAAAEFFHKASGLRAFALATLAQVFLAQDRVAEALERAREAKSILEAGSIEEGEALVRLSWAESLHRAGRIEEARDAIVEARDRLLSRAGKIVDASLRKSFLERVPENARTLSRAAEWLDSLPPEARRA
jgi:tetratricopeptide (TPR) repeat protein